MRSLVETYGLNFPENALTLKCSKHIFRDVSKPKYLGGGGRFSTNSQYDLKSI